MQYIKYTAVLLVTQLPPSTPITPLYPTVPHSSPQYPLLLQYPKVPSSSKNCQLQFQNLYVEFDLFYFQAFNV